jgi:hypothetical protein
MLEHEWKNTFEAWNMILRDNMFAAINDDAALAEVEVRQCNPSPNGRGNGEDGADESRPFWNELPITGQGQKVPLAMSCPSGGASFQS